MDIRLLIGVAIGLFLGWMWRFVRERGHAVYGVDSEKVQEVMKLIITRYTTLRPLNMIHSGGTHQQVYRGGTVVAWFENLPSLANLPKNARSYVVWGKRKRQKAVTELVRRLKELGYTAEVHEPLPFPLGTFMMVQSNAFKENLVAFRPHWIKMAVLEIMG